MQKKTVKKFCLLVLTVLLFCGISALTACDFSLFGPNQTEGDNTQGTEGTRPGNNQTGPETDNGSGTEDETTPPQGDGEIVTPQHLQQKLNAQIDKVLENNNNGTQTYGKFTDVAKESSYLGYGYNIVNSPYMDKNAIKIAYPIVDPIKIQDVTLKMVKENRVHSYVVESDNMEEFSQSYSNKLSLGAGVGKLFSVGLSTMFGGSEEEKMFYKFFNSTVCVNTFNLYMVSYHDKLQEILSSSFKKALKEMDAEKLFTTYGTHMINSVAMGGRMEANQVYSSATKKYSSDLEITINSHAKAGLVANVNAENATKYSEALSASNVQNQTEIRQLGGKTLDVSTVEALAKNYQAWFESFYDDLGVSAVCGVVNEGSLTPVWELLPPGEEERAEELEAAFLAYSDENYNALLSKYKLKTPVPPKTFTIEGQPQSCEVDNGFNTNRPSTNYEAINEANNYVCDLVLNGCIENENGYGIGGFGGNEEISLGIKLIQDPKAIWVKGSKNYYKADICDDGATTAVNTNINKRIGKGAVYIHIEYTDMTATEGFATNIFNGKTKDSFIDILSVTGMKIDENKVVKKITVDVVYEIAIGYKDFVGWVTYYNYTNWRVHKVLNFI